MNVTNINNQRRAYYSERSNRSAIYWKHFAFVAKGFCSGRTDLKFTEARTILWGIFRMSSISLQILRTHILERKYLSIFPLYIREPLRNEPGSFLRSRPKVTVTNVYVPRSWLASVIVFIFFPIPWKWLIRFVVSRSSKRFQESTGEEFLWEGSNIRRMLVQFERGSTEK